MRRWEYEVLHFDHNTDGDLSTRLNQYGRNGWELVTSFPDGETSYIVNFVFKRLSSNRRSSSRSSSNNRYSANAYDRHEYEYD